MENHAATKKKKKELGFDLDCFALTMDGREKKKRRESAISWRGKMVGVWRSSNGAMGRRWEVGGRCKVRRRKEKKEEKRTRGVDRFGRNK